MSRKALAELFAHLGQDVAAVLELGDRSRSYAGGFREIFAGPAKARPCHSALKNIHRT